MRRALLALFAAALASGCSGPPSATAPTPAPAAGVARAPREEGYALASRGDHAAAVTKYREALRATPDDLTLRFALGSALSQVDRRDETIEQFRWVVEHGGPGQAEVAMAREWLAAAERASGSDAPPSRRAATAPGVPATQSQPASPAGVGSIKGKTAWPGVNPDSQIVSLEIRLNGDDAATKDKSFRLHIPLGRPYVMSGLAAGAYRLMGRSAGVKVWETRVVVGASKDTVLDLTDSNALVTPKDFTPQDG